MIGVAKVITDACKASQYKATELAQKAERSNAVNDADLLDVISDIYAEPATPELLDKIVQGFGKL